MTPLLPLVALALAFAAPFLSRAERGRIDPLRVGALAALLFVAAFVVFRAAPEVDRTPALVGLVLGGLACVLGEWGGGVAFGVAAASALHLLPATSLPAAGLALVAGTGLGALAVGGESAALAAALVVAADNLGLRHSQVPAAAFVGSQAGLAAAIAGFASTFLPREGFAWGKAVVGAVLLALSGLVVQRALNEKGIETTLLLGAAAGLVVHFLMPDDEGESSRVGLAAIIGVALGAVAFGLGKGLGMALATLAAVGTLLVAENRCAVLALGPLVGLTLYRVLREAGTGATRAIDLAQHYTLLALVLGLVLPLLPVDWMAVRTKVRAAGAVLWGLAAIAAAPIVVVVLGQRGGIGFVVGLGIAGLVQALRARVTLPEDEKSHAGHPLQPLALGTGLAGATILALAWLGDESTLSREAKVHLFAYAAAGIAALTVLLALTGRSKERRVQ